jgi:hypothetical protein
VHFLTTNRYFRDVLFNLDFVLTGGSQARNLTNVPSSQAASSTIRDLFGGNGTGPTQSLRALGSGVDGTRIGCIVRSRTNGRDSQERVGSPTRIPESRSSGEGLPSGRRLAKRPGQAKWCVAPSGCLGHLSSARPERPEDNVPITDLRIGYRAAPTVSRVFPFGIPPSTPPTNPKKESSTSQFSPLSLRAIGVSTLGRLAIRSAVKEMESRPVIADEQSLERLEDEEPDQDEEEGLDDVLVDDLDEELDILGEADLVEEDDDDESTEAEDEEEEVEEEDDDESDDVVDDSDTSLEELLAQRTAARQIGDDPDEEDDDFIALSSEATRTESPPKSKVVTALRNREEFVCKRCFLLKPKVQLADSERMLCRDCV